MRDDSYELFPIETSTGKKITSAHRSNHARKSTTRLVAVNHISFDLDRDRLGQRDLLSSTNSITQFYFRG